MRKTRETRIWAAESHYSVGNSPERNDCQGERTRQTTQGFRVRLEFDLLVPVQSSRYSLLSLLRLWTLHGHFWRVSGGRHAHTYTFDTPFFTAGTYWVVGGSNPSQNLTSGNLELRQSVYVARIICKSRAGRCPDCVRHISKVESRQENHRGGVQHLPCTLQIMPSLSDFQPCGFLLLAKNPNEYGCGSPTVHELDSAALPSCVAWFLLPFTEPIYCQ